MPKRIAVRTQWVAPANTATSPRPANKLIGKGKIAIKALPKTAPIKNKAIANPNPRKSCCAC